MYMNCILVSFKERYDICIKMFVSDINWMFMSALPTIKKTRHSCQDD